MTKKLWLLVIVAECIFVTSGQRVNERRCAFQAKPQNFKFKEAGNVNGSEQICKHTQCCVGYFELVDDQPVVDLQACDMINQACPNTTCEATTHTANYFIKCACNTDFCNRNITWMPQLDRPQPNRPQPNRPQQNYSYAMKVTIAIPIGTVLFAFIVLIAVKWRHCLKQNDETQASLLDDALSPLCSCKTKPLINIADVERHQAIGHGSFATVWEGKYQGSVVAVKMFYASCKQFFTEKDIYELPLMEHSGIIRFLGAGRCGEAGQLLIILELATCGSLQNFLCNNIGSWLTSLKLSQSLSEGLEYLHSDIHRHGVHKPTVAHRDLSSGNVLVRADGTCALSDFGCSTILRSCSRQCPIGSVEVNMQDSTLVGSLRYMSPEILEGSVNLSGGQGLMQADIYSLGLLLWEIWTRCAFEDNMVPEHNLPYEVELESNVSLERLIVYVSQMNKRLSIPKCWEQVPQGPLLQEIVENCWDHDPEARLTAHCVVGRLHSLLDLSDM